MKRLYFLSFLLSTILSLNSCKEEVDKFKEKGTCSIVSFSGPESAYMGDSINFQFNVENKGINLNQAKLQFLFDEKILSERILIIPSNGQYEGKILVPFEKNISDGVFKVKLRVQNERFETDEKILELNVIRPIFEKLVLKTENGDYEMLPVDGELYKYSVKGNFPSELFAHIEASPYGENGNKITWGSLDGKISNSGTDMINFSADTDEDYEISFNTKTFEGNPFIKFAVNEQEFEKIDDYNFKVDRLFKQHEVIEITGLKSDYENYWINPSFFAKIKGTDGKKLKFLARDGYYRLTVIKESSKKHFKMEVLNSEGTDFGILENGDDAIWCIGDGNVGFPSFRSNGINWNPSNAISVAPMGNGTHKIIFKKGETLGDYINFKFFNQKGWGKEFVASSYSDKSGLSPWFVVDTGENGNIKSGDTPLKDNCFYEITIDISETNSNSSAKISAREIDRIEEVDMP